MQVLTKRRYIVTFDEDEAEDILNDPTVFQKRLREQMNLPSSTKISAATLAP